MKQLLKKYVFVGTKTCSGKSLTYKCIPELFSESCVIIILLLIFIMNEQWKKLTASGFNVSYIGHNSCDIDSKLRGKMDFNYISLEQLVKDKR